MALVESLQKAIDYMEEHLKDHITIEDIAKQANVSPFHFQRTFMILTGISVGEYLRRRRLTLAAQELSTTNCKIIDLAHKYGYDTPESFSKAFRKQHGVTPSEMRKGIGKLHSYNRLTIQVNLKGADPMKYRIVERDAFQIVGIKQEFSCVTEEMDAVIPKLWDEAHKSGTIDLLIQLNNGQISGLLGVIVDFSGQKNVMEYWIATEYIGGVPDGLSRFEIPASKWVVFEVRGPVPDAIKKYMETNFFRMVPI
ncbi:AraC family transcriptional regulator [Thermoflavimicrobium dichotomicum]|uniref:AraC family transcriptional regulator n=1 Tax=Thermoflavimicrobium dichotomicum TaxID=46223 RepID=A0A1I3S9B5_9BACL|nr:AraC family transcriptional regulator [Thermoflavimicrobium dichotomicum]